MTPVTRKFWSSSRMVLPTMAGSAAKRRRHRRSLRTTSRSRPGWSSPVLKAAADRRLDAERVEEIGADQRLDDALRLAAGADDVGHAALPGGQVLDRGALAADVVEIGRGGAVPLVRRCPESRCSTMTRVSRCGRAMGFQSRASHTLKMAVVAPMPERQGEHRGDRETRETCAACARRNGCPATGS